MLTDFVCLYTYELWLSLCKIVRSSVILLLPLYKTCLQKIFVIQAISLFVKWCYCANAFKTRLEARCGYVILVELLIISGKLFYKLYVCLNFVLAWQNRFKETTDTASSESFLDLYLEFNDSGHLTTTFYDKRDDFNFKIINFPNMCSNIPASPAYGVYISQLIRYARTISNYSDFLKQHLYLRNRLLDQGHEQIRLIRPLKMVHDRCSTLLTKFGTALTTILPIWFQYCYKYCYSDNQNLWAVLEVAL